MSDQANDNIFTMPKLEYGEMSWTAKKTTDPTQWALPTYEPDEQKVREDLQAPLDYLAQQWNQSESLPDDPSKWTLGDRLARFCNSFGGLIPCGDYDSAVESYAKLSLVWHNGYSYVAKQAVDQSEDPIEPGVAEDWEDYWQKFAQSLSEEVDVTTEEDSSGNLNVTAEIALDESDIPKLGFIFTNFASTGSVSTRPIIVKGTITLQTAGELTITTNPHRRIISCSAHKTTDGGPYYLYNEGFMVHTFRNSQAVWVVGGWSLVSPTDAFGHSITLANSAPAGTYEYVALLYPEVIST